MHLSEGVAKRGHNVTGTDRSNYVPNRECAIIETCKNVRNFILIVQYDPTIAAIASVELLVGHLHLMIGADRCEGVCHSCEKQTWDD